MYKKHFFLKNYSSCIKQILSNYGNNINKYNTQILSILIQSYYENKNYKELTNLIKDILNNKLNKELPFPFIEMIFEICIKIKEFKLVDEIILNFNITNEKLLNYYHYQKQLEDELKQQQEFNPYLPINNSSFSYLHFRQEQQDELQYNNNNTTASIHNNTTNNNATNKNKNTKMKDLY
ncbi:hypothetical protein ABK040_002208 [Willaertia magna]